MVNFIKICFEASMKKIRKTRAQGEQQQNMGGFVCCFLENLSNYFGHQLK